MSSVWSRPLDAPRRAEVERKEAEIRELLKRPRESEAVARAKYAVMTGKLVECSAEEYPEVREALQDYAGALIDTDDHVRAIIALEEVRRLDGKFGV